MILPEPPLSCKVYTPKPLAVAMINVIARRERQRWLEPSCGSGAFIEALHDQGISPRDIVGVDLDKNLATADSLGQVSRGCDFLDWSKTRGGRFDCVVGNPPFVAINQLPTLLRQTASAVADLDGMPIGERSNTWYPFMVRAIKLLRSGGSMAFVLPAACEYADYAAVGRSRLTSYFERVDVIRSRRPLFDGVAEGVVVLIAQGKGGTGKHYRRHEVDDLSAVIGRLQSLSNFNARSCPAQRGGSQLEARIRLGDVIDIRIGGVTGDSNYFVLSESERHAQRLPQSAFVPVLSRSKHAFNSDISMTTWESLRAADERVWLFRPEDRHLNQVAVGHYLALCKSEGGCDRSRYKIRLRNPWHRTPLPDQPDLFLTGMSGAGLWMCINEFSSLNATNTLYVGKFKEPQLRREKYAWALGLLTSRVQKQVLRSRRVYADGLSKLEPSQIADLEVPVPPLIRDAISKYRRVVAMFLDSKQSQAMAEADAVFQRRS
ncbi:MAG: SAM-dependent DNA methyltransferase [Planctomycetales bacterium]|nr:SAM-dependent DNA methyltransferase [Planctomycetales bacterium]